MPFLIINHAYYARVSAKLILSHQTVHSNNRLERRLCVIGGLN